ncbi:unnamed protein product, partial [Cyprideis torosa]
MNEYVDLPISLWLTDDNHNISPYIQVPQFLLDYCYEMNQDCRIVVTQPRRIAARALACRVSETREWRLGGLVGYQIGMDNRHRSPNTRLLYLTTPILLKMFAQRKSISQFTHVVLDEFHERDLDSDLVLLACRLLLADLDHGGTTKLIVMSATLNIDPLVQYFKAVQLKTATFSVSQQHPAASDSRQWVSAAGFRVEKRWLRSIKDYLAADLEICSRERPACEWQQEYEALLSPRFDQPAISDLEFELVARLLLTLRSEEVGWEEELSRGSHRDKVETTDRIPGAVLIFLPGEAEILSLRSILWEASLKYSRNEEWSLLPVHSRLTRDEQDRVFQAPEPGVRKIILATNICESSLTIPDVVYVVDFCRTREIHWDSETHLERLQLKWASQANLKQRAGRVGRVRWGRVYRTIPEEFGRKLREFPAPEILRAPLDKLVLTVKILDLGSPRM